MIILYASAALVIVLMVRGVVSLKKMKKSQATPPRQSDQMRYVAVGDSYTSGEGVAPNESWPALLTNHLAANGINLRLIANPSRTGWTTQDAIDLGLPVYEAARPTFATLLIGVNDWVQGVDANNFRQRLALLLDQMLVVLPQKNHLVVVTIPDFSVTPNGGQYAGGRNISVGIGAFNAIVKEEAERRRLKVADIFPKSQEMQKDPSLVAPDGLHPSGKEYALWEKIIFPVVCDVLIPLQDTTNR